MIRLYVEGEIDAKCLCSGWESAIHAYNYLKKSYKEIRAYRGNKEITDELLEKLVSSK